MRCCCRPPCSPPTRGLRSIGITAMFIPSSVLRVLRNYCPKLNGSTGVLMGKANDHGLIAATDVIKSTFPGTRDPSTTAHSASPSASVGKCHRASTMTLRMIRKGPSRSSSMADLKRSCIATLRLGDTYGEGKGISVRTTASGKKSRPASHIYYRIGSGSGGFSFVHLHC